MTFLLNSCSDSETSDSASDDAVPYAVFSNEEFDSEFPDSLFEGTVDVRSDCVYLEDEFSRYIPVFDEARASWDQDSMSITIGSVTLSDGDTLRAGGGAVGGREDYSVPPACVDVPWFVIGSFS